MNPFFRRLLWGSTLATALTGFLYFWFRNFLEPMNEWAVINHPLEPWVLKAHILVAPVMVFSVGTIAADHVFQYARSAISEGRTSGMTITAVLVPLVASGYLLQVVTHPGVVRGLSWTHTVLGTVGFLFFAWHRTVRRKGRRAREERYAREVDPSVSGLGPGAPRRPSSAGPTDPSPRRSTRRGSDEPRLLRPGASTSSPGRGV